MKKYVSYIVEVLFHPTAVKCGTETQVHSGIGDIEGFIIFPCGSVQKEPNKDPTIESHIFLIPLCLNIVTYVGHACFKVRGNSLFH